MLITVKDLVAIGYGKSQSGDIIRRAKRLMVNEGFSYYENRRLGKVPVEAIEKILGIKWEVFKDAQNC